MVELFNILFENKVNSSHSISRYDPGTPQVSSAPTVQRKHSPWELEKAYEQSCSIQS
jgi:hypothetical protein